MNITFKNPGFEYSFDSIMLFQTEEQTPFWSDAIFYFYPQIEAEKLIGRSFSERRDYLHSVFGKIYEETKDELDRKTDFYNSHFAKHREQIEEALSEAFETDSGMLFNNLTGNITLNPVCPRFLEECRFDIFYKNSERGALGLSLHEVIHYFWFHIWNRHFSDSYDEYETPSLKWILSEMVVEAIMSDPRLSSINPYFPREEGGCVYSYFYNMVIGGRPVLETLKDLYRENSITDFMEKAFAYCAENESDIRRHIEEAEK